MGFSFNGKVLRSAQIATANAVTTGDVNTGVVRDARPVPVIYTTSADAPSFVDAAANQYRAAIIDAPGTTPNEYTIWAANTADLSGPIDTDSTWWTEDGTGIFPVDSITVGVYTDGTNKVIIRDNGNRDMDRIFAVVVSRGDVTDYDDDGWKNPDDVNPATYGGQPRLGTNPYITLYFDVAQQDSRQGIGYLTNAHLATLGGGLSRDRGDKVITVHYTVGSARFFWTRNDRYEARFGWNGRERRWTPFKGTAPKNLGTIQIDVMNYFMNPAVRNLPIGAFLPGNALTPDAYSMIRVGVTPSAVSSIPVDLIKVVSDDAVRSPFDFLLEPGVNGVVGQTNGMMQFSPAFIIANAGRHLWYVYKGFQETSDGIIGKMVDSDLFIAPIPSPTDMPLIRFGSRKYLTPHMVLTDAALIALPDPLSGNVNISASTGKVKLSPIDVAKADPNSVNFSKYFLGEDVVYDGVSLSGKIQPTRAPVQLVDQNGNPATSSSSEMYIPAYQYLPTEFIAANTRRGLGQSGILDAPDGTGAVPDHPATVAPIRPGGDNTVDITTGRVRQIHDGVSDTIVYSQHGSISTIIEVDHNSDLPSHSYDIPGGTAYIARQSSTHGSRVMIGDVDRARFSNKPMFFLQAALNPATWTDQARLFSRNRDIFRFTGLEALRFAVDGVGHTWTSAALVAAHPGQAFFTSDEVAADINLVTPHAYAYNGYIVLEASNPTTGSVEIGWGVGGVLDFTGATALGFVPGWKVVGGVDNWLPDSGISMGLYRSPLDLDGSQGISDFQATERTQDYQVITDSVPGNPFYFLDKVPLQDIAGINEGEFFALLTESTVNETPVTTYQNLSHYQEVIYRFGQRKFDWVQEGFDVNTVTNATVTLNLGAAGIAPESLETAIGGGLYVSKDGGPLTLLQRDVDYILPQEGIPGTSTLIQRFLRKLTEGAQGVTTAGSPFFVDANADFSVAAVGDIISIGHGTEHFYKVESVVNATALQVSPTPTFTGSLLPWDLHEGYPDSVYAPIIVADMSYKEFNHLPQEVMVIKVLSPIGASYKADMAAALANGRQFNLRFGLENASLTNQVALTALQQLELGQIGNGTLTVPDTSRLDNGQFSIRVGTQVFVNNVDLIPVFSFSADPAGIEYLLAATIDDPRGRLKFGSSVLSGQASSLVYYIELFKLGTELAAGQGEYDPNTGIVNISDADQTANAGKPLYFVEQLITENRKDVSLNPMLGAFSPNVPLSKGSSVEASYWAADLEGRKTGDQITEFLPVFVRNETMTRTLQNVYLFNASRVHTIDQSIPPLVYIGPIQQNFGQLDYVVDYPADLLGQGRITFVSHAVPDYVPVTITYAVFDMLGGERAFEVSTKPVYRPPFFIKAGQNRFGIRGNRVSEFAPGQMFRIGQDCFYVKALQYYPQNAQGTGDVTSISIFPSTVNEVGSRAPGNDVVTVITYGPITTVVDPDGTTPVPTTAPAGFMSALSLVGFPFEPISRGQSIVVFRGDLTKFAVAGHILEIGGTPYTIADVTIDADGSRTSITVTSIFWRGFAVEDNPTVKLSYRPVYPPFATDLIGIGPQDANWAHNGRDGSILESEGFGLLLFEPGKPGRDLVPDLDYTLDTSTGAIHLLSPDGLIPGQHIDMAFTRVNPLRPYMKDGIMVIPRFQAKYLSQGIPSEANGLLNRTLVGTYTYSSPDAFYFRAVSLTSFLGEAVQEALAEIAAKQPASGSLIFPHEGAKNWQQGRFGFTGERRHLLDKDRAARTFLDFFNTVIVAFEQVEETIAGGFIGDRDGKFRFRVGHGADYPTPGYEDDITGYMTPYNVWTGVVNETNPSVKYFGLDSDWMVDPATFTVVNGEVNGTLLDTEAFYRLGAQQKGLIHNDVDDVVLTGIGSTHLEFDASFPFFHMKAKGTFQPMWESHRMSRLFPTITKAFLRTLPGIGYDPTNGQAGVYTAGRTLGGKQSRTTGSSIGQLHNPVLGNITHVQAADLHKRRARARIWGYFPNGIPSGAFGPMTPPAAITDPCIIAVPAMMRDIPILPETGYPDIAKFLSQGGTIQDALVGDPALAVPGFEPGDQITWGKPDGTIYPAFNSSDPIDIYSVPTYTGVFVRDVQYGCVLRFQASDGASITNPLFIMAGDTTASLLPVEQGDTLFVGASPEVFSAPPPDPAEFSTLQAMNGGLDTYRDGFDVKVMPDGSMIDITMKSALDGSFFAFKEIFGQNSPQPLSSLEGTITFGYDALTPLMIPALNGGIQDDSGDYQIPYIRTGNTEMDRFAQAAVGLSAIFTADSWLSHALYPNEILGDDGQVVTTVGALPASLNTSMNTSPGFGPGEGNVRPYDLILCQLTNPNPFSTVGAIGIHTVGAVAAGNPSVIEPPRFVTATKPPVLGSNQTGDPVNYYLQNAMVFVEGPYHDHPQADLSPPRGVYIIEDTVANTTVLEFGSTTITLNDGQTIGVGSLNDIVNASASNVVTLKIISRRDLDIVNGLPGINPSPWAGAGGNVALTIRIRNNAWEVEDYQGGITGWLGVAPVFGGAGNRQITLVGVGKIPWGPGPGTPAQWFLPHVVAAGPTYSTLYGLEFTFDIDTRSGQSTTAWISDDRLTFNEVCDLSFAKQRRFVHPQSSMDLETKLSITGITVGQTAGIAVTSTINNYINGMNGPDPIPLTFVPRMDANTVGYFAPRVGAVTERGVIKAMAFEGHSDIAGNQTITGTGVTFSAIPSNELTDLTVSHILTGTGKTASRFNADLTVLERAKYDNRVTDISVSDGLALYVEPGDILVIKESANVAHPATHQAGTYLVRHAVDPHGGGSSYWAHPSTVAGNEDGWCPLHFPTIVSFVDGTNTLTISDVAPAEGGPAVGGIPGGFPAVGPATRIYAVRSITNLASSDAAVYRTSVISARYTAIALGLGDTGVLTLTDYQDAFGNPITAADFKALVEAGGPYPVSGMTYWPINVTGTDLPSNNCVGLDTDSIPGPHPADGSIYGFHQLDLIPPAPLSAASSLQFMGNDFAVPGIRKVPVAQCVVPIPGVVANAFTFQSDPARAIYDWVVRTLDVREVTHAQWEALNIPPASAGFGVSAVDCVLPGTLLNLGDSINPGFNAQAGVFLEPTFPRSSMSLTAIYEHIVDATHSFPNPSIMSDWHRDIGMRDSQEYYTPVVVPNPDEVTFEVRRIRRFHDVLNIADQNLAPLRFAYEIRRGIISGYTIGDKQNGNVTANFTMNWNTAHPGFPLAPDVWNDGKVYAGTNLGGFDNGDVNIHPGDLFRLLDEHGVVQEEVRVESVQDGQTIILASPGLRVNNPVGFRFEVFLKRAPVPHEQSCEELLELITERAVCRTEANWVTQAGGYVPDITGVTTYANAVNRLCDDLNASGSGNTFAKLGVQKGDIIIIDPAGTIPQDGGMPVVPEKGTRPLGDEGVPVRVAAGVYVAGTPSLVDDNRGFYRVKQVVDSASPPYLLVDPINTYAGGEATPVLFGDTAHAYAVYPTITDSRLKKVPYPVINPAYESQMALRPTLKRDAVTKSFKVRTDSFLGHSIRPFSYHVIRPSKLFSDVAIDLVLMMRERMLSLIELLQRAMKGTKSGSYFIFQRDEHIKELGSPTDPDLGLGVPSNLYIEAVGGRMDIVPYANNSACLSLMDRRVWIHDTRLDSLTANVTSVGGMRTSMPGDTSYTAFTDVAGSTILPVLPERIDDVLNSRDKFRQVRYVWLSYRTHQVQGTLAAINRLEADIPNRLDAQKNIVALNNSVSDV